MTNNQLTDERIEKIAVWLATESHSLNLEMLTCLRELQERRKAAMDREPVGWTDEEELRDVERGGCGYLFTVNPVTPHADERRIILLYRHAQPAPKTEREPIAWLNDAYLARGVVDGEAGSEDAGPGYIPVYREASPAQPVPVVPDDLLHMAASAIEDLLEHTDPNTSYYSGMWADVPGKLRSSMLQAGNSPVIPDTWIPVSERMPENNVSVLTFDGMYRRVHHAMYGHWQCWEPEKITHWIPLPAAPQEVKGE